MSAEWDAALGVWKGSKAATSLSSELPNPLYIFGYGSLLWRPGDLLSKYPAYPCVCYGWRRLFAQRSMDHRGTTQFPGFVATLVSDNYFTEGETALSSSSECVGIAFLVPHEEAQELIAELDYREKGGYHRHIISVKLLERTVHHNQFDHANALVYTGPTDNPNFSLELSLTNWEAQVARIVSISVGPSGENSEYLLQLASFVSQQLQQDGYLTNLAKMVFETMCPWRGRWMLQRCNQLSQSQYQPLGPGTLFESNLEVTATSGGGPLLLGWGSNESSQLSGVQSFKAHFHSSSLPLNHCDSTSPSHLIMIPTHLGSFSARTPDQIVNPNQLYSPSLLHYQVYAGGSRSALQCHTRLYIWGDIGTSPSSTPTALPASLSPPGSGRGQQKGWRKTFHLVENLSSPATAPSLMISQEEVIVDSVIHCSSQSPAYEAMVFDGVESIAMGHRHNLILSHDRTTVLAFGDDTCQQCSDRSACVSIDRLSAVRLTVAKLSAGLHHSALLTTSGLVYTWGDHSHGQCLPEELSPWHAPLVTDSAESSGGVIPRVLDIACGAHHTVLIDTIGRVFTFGENK
jgi:glutathione-specific gamma-glutamylcyclotransferase